MLDRKQHFSATFLCVLPVLGLDPGLFYPRNSFSFYTVFEVLFMPQFPHIFLAFLLSLCLSVLSVSAFDTPLSDQAIREAYFLGQRHDGSLASFLGKYIKQLPPPQTGPYISSVAFFTPFAQLVQISDKYIGNYSAQQAALDHRGQAEFVHIVVGIQLTPTYGAYRLRPPPQRHRPIHRMHHRRARPPRLNQVGF